MPKNFLPYSIDQQILLPTNIREWLPEGHLALFVLDVIDSLDLSAIYAVYNQKDPRGRLAFNPNMMASLLIYAYCVGQYSSRKIEKSTYDNVAFRVLSGDQHPDHDSIAAFRKIHLKALGDLFIQVFQLCQKAGIVKLGHIAIDGSKILANASKHKAMSYDVMCAKEKALELEVLEMLGKAQQIDAEEDSKYGSGVRGDDLPAELQRRESRLKKIKEAKAMLEAEAKAEAKREADESKKKTRRSPYELADDNVIPLAKSQKNFTDPDSRIMPDNARKGSFIQCYNVQIAVDSEAQIIVATGFTQKANDRQQLVPMTEKIIKNCGTLAKVTSADSGYFSDEAVSSSMMQGTNLLVPPNRVDKKEEREPPQRKKSPLKSAIAKTMREKLSKPANKQLYRMRKAVVEPVFGQIKEVRSFRRFSMRGFISAGLEFELIAATHNLLKLYRSGKMSPRAISTS
jgi:transposase